MIIASESSAYGGAWPGKGLFLLFSRTVYIALNRMWSSQSPDKKDRARRDPPAGWFVQIIWVGQAEEAVLGHRVCIPHRWCFETLSASFLQPQLCVGIASCLKNVFPFRMHLIVHPHRYWYMCRKDAFVAEMYVVEIWGKSIYKKDDDWGLQKVILTL